jgi:thioredoxin reductase (NADPH)
MPKVKDVTIIGGGPAGLAAAIYNSRANLEPFVFGGAPYGGQLMLTSDVENYPGFDSILGPDLIEKMRAHAKKFGTTVVDKNITKLDLSKRPFELYTSEEKYQSKAVIITTGAKAIWLGLESETRLRGKGVSACATCDGFFFKDKEIAVVGGGDSAMEEALFLTKFASKIYIIHRRDEFRASQIMQDRVKKHPKIEILWNTEVEEVLGENKVEGVKIKKTPPVIPAEAGIQNKTGSPIGVGDDKRGTDDNNSEFRVLPVEGVFIAIGHKPDTDLFKGKIELDKKGYIVTSQVDALRKATSPRHPGVNLVSDRILNKKDSITSFQNDKDTARVGIRNFDYGYQSMTSVPGVFAAGDCVDHIYRQAGTAVGMGIAAAMEAEKWLEEKS